MTANIAIVPLSDSFSKVWPELAHSSKVKFVKVATLEEVRTSRVLDGVMLSAGGEEVLALTALKEFGRPMVHDLVVVGAETDYRLAAAILQAGAFNYFAFPGDVGLCRSWLIDRANSVEDRRRGQEFAADERERFDFSKLIGESPGLRASLARTARVIPRGKANVLITGETGTGKELLARAVHYNGCRAAQPFVEINCTTLPDNLLEAELFGYEPGAFTDAKVAKPGLFEIADRGTLFLDEIGDLSLSLQGKLLRVLEAKRIRRLGSVDEVQIDVRVVAATNVNLEAAVEAGTFREDLYYRLNVIPIHLPPLRERGEDVVRLARHFLERFSREYELPTPDLTARVCQALRLHSWPGNVRELRNSIERAVLLGDGQICVEDLFPNMPAGTRSTALPFPAPLATIERAAATAMVERCNGNKTEAAKALGVSRKHLYTLLRAEANR